MLLLCEIHMNAVKKISPVDSVLEFLSFMCPSWNFQSSKSRVKSSWLDPALMNCCFILVNLNFSTLMITYIICICMCVYVCMSWTTGYAFMENKGIVCFFYFEAYHHHNISKWNSPAFFRALFQVGPQLIKGKDDKAT